MSEVVKFQVDPALTKILGDSYSSVEAAVKELIDNAFDADSTIVKVTVPALVDDPEIIIEDNGDGMTKTDVRDQYLKIASSRLSRKGDFTAGKGRKVKGRKGIGKFAGLTVANQMEITTRARGQETKLIICKSDILGREVDLESIDMPIQVSDCNPEDRGTTIKLIGLTQNLLFPNPEKLKQLLTREYLRENDFQILVNGDTVSVSDIPGKKFEKHITLPNGQSVTVIATLTEKQNRFYGVNYRVDGKVVGKPTNLLENHDYIPINLQKRMYVEVTADCLKDDVSADWGMINESSKSRQQIEDELKSFLEASLKEGSKMEMAAAKARHQKKINAYLSKQPEYRQKFAKAALEKVIDKFWAEETAKVQTIVNLMIDAFEKGHYWVVLEMIDKADENHIEDLAAAFEEFGLYEITRMTQEASAKAKFLNKLEVLFSNDDTLESAMHQALANNLWVLGYEYSHYINNQSLKRSAEVLCDKVYKGEHGSKRPDLFLGMAFNREKLLIEFKRPSHTLTRLDEGQAQTYRDELEVMFPNQQIKVMLIGGKKADKINPANNAAHLIYHTYTEIIANARANYDWLIENLIQETTT